MVEEKHGELNFSYAILGMAESNRIQTDAYRTGHSVSESTVIEDYFIAPTEAAGFTARKTDNTNLRNDLDCYKIRVEEGICDYRLY